MYRAMIEFSNELIPYKKRKKANDLNIIHHKDNKNCTSIMIKTYIDIHGCSTCENKFTSYQIHHSSFEFSYSSSLLQNLF